MPVEILLDFVAVQIIGDHATATDITINLDFTDIGEQWTMWIRRGVLNARRGQAPDARLTLAGPKPAITAVLLKPAAAEQLSSAETIHVDGDRAALKELGAILDDFEPAFPIVTP
jgi:alkyl sulfatase BDS1-like metallo-beta-lactamase superfamily hydrolase